MTNAFKKRVQQFVGRITKSKDGKTLIANFGYLSLLQIASYVLPLITMPYLARIIGVEGFGKIAFASAIIVWFQTIADWGFNYTATRDVAKNRENIEFVSDVFSRVFWARCVLMIISFVVLFFLIVAIPQFKECAGIIFVTFLLIPGHIMFPDWLFQAMERMKFITYLNLLTKLLFTVLVFLFIKDKGDYMLQPLFVSLGYVVSGLIAMYIIIYRWNVKLRLAEFRTIVWTIKSSTDVFINNIMPNFYNSFSSVVLGLWGGQAANGLLDAGSRFVNIAIQFLSVITRTFYPFLSRRIDQHAMFARVNIVIAIFATIIVFWYSPFLIHLFFTEEFEESILVLRIMSFSVLFVALSNTYGMNYMLVQGYDKQLRILTTWCSLFGFVIALPLIYIHTYIGAAIVITVTRGLLGFSALLYVKRRLIK